MPELKKITYSLLIIAVVLWMPASGFSGGCEFSTLTGNYNPCNPDWALQWSADNPQMIDPLDPENSASGHATIKFEGGRPPYSWEVSGNGFWFDEQSASTSIETRTFSTRLYVDSGACGSATLTVTDACGARAVAYIASSYGIRGSAVDCNAPGWHYIEKVQKSKAHTAGCPSEYCNNWFAGLDCKEDLICDPGGAAHYDACRCTIYRCYEWLCPQ